MNERGMHVEDVFKNYVTDTEEVPLADWSPRELDRAHYAIKVDVHKNCLDNLHNFVHVDLGDYAQLYVESSDQPYSYVLYLTEDRKLVLTWIGEEPENVIKIAWMADPVLLYETKE